MLFLIDPSSFQSTWKGRAQYLLFLGFFLLELFTARKKLLKNKFGLIKRKRTLAIGAAMAAPTIYVISVSMFGLSHAVIEIGELFGAGQYGEWFLKDSWPLSLEYLILTGLFTVSIKLVYKIKGLKQFLASLFFLGATGTFYMIDTFYPYGTFTALQSFVPFTASSATLVLDWMGYGTRLFAGPYGAVHMLVGGPTGGAHWYLYWPCAGVHNLFIYTLMVPFLLQGFSFRPQREVIYASVSRKLRFAAKNNRLLPFLEHRLLRTAITVAESSFINIIRTIPIFLITVIGAVGIFTMNVFRIVTISVIGSKIGSESAHLFHNYRGELYFVVWVIIYLIILLTLNRRIRT